MNSDVIITCAITGDAMGARVLAPAPARERLKLH